MFRWKSFVVILVGFAVLLLAGVPLAVPDQAIAGFLPSLDGIQELLAGVALGWKQLLTIALPVGDYQALLVPAFVLVLTSTIVALTVALRARWGELGRPAAHRPVRRRDRVRAREGAVAGAMGARRCSPSCCCGWSGGAGASAASRSGC